MKVFKLFLLLITLSCCLSAKVERIIDLGPIEHHLLLDGKLAPLKTLTIHSPFEGNLIEVLQQGSEVTKGETLAVLDTFEIEQLARRARYDESLKQVELRKLRLEHEIEDLKDLDSLASREKDLQIQKIVFEQRKFSRDPVNLLRLELEIEKHFQMILFYSSHLSELEKLGEKGALSTTQLADERLQFKEYQVRLEQLKIELETLREGDHLQIEKARRDLQKAEVLHQFAVRQMQENKNLRELAEKVLVVDLEKLSADAKKETDSLKEAAIRAPESGVFLMRDHWVGDGFGTYKAGHRISEKSLLGEISRQSQLKGAFPVREIDLGQIKIGQDVLYQVLPLGKRWYRGRVSKIEKVLQEVATWQKDLYAIKTIPVEVELLETSELMKPKMTLLAKILTGRRESGVRIEHGCLWDGNRAFVSSKGMIPLKIGLEGTQYAEVLEGISPGDTVMCLGIDPLSKIRWNRQGRVKSKEIFQSVRGTGILQSRREILLGPAFSSTILKILDTGTEVKKGEALVVLDSKAKETELQSKEIDLTEKKVDLEATSLQGKQKLVELTEEITELKLRLESEQAQLSILARGSPHLEIEKQEIQVTLAEVERKFQDLSFEVQEILKKRGYLKNQEYQSALEELKNSKIQNQLTSLELELKKSPASSKEIQKQEYRVQYLKNSIGTKRKIMELTKEGTQIEQALSQTAVQKAEFEVRTLQKILKKAIIRASKAGVFLIQDHWGQGKMIPYKAGDSISPGSLVGKLVEMDEFYISGKLGEEAYHSLKPGQEVRFILSGRKDRNFPGVLEAISPVPHLGTRLSREGEPMISVEISVRVQSRSFQPGASVNYEILVSSPSQGLVIPSAALYEREGKTIVFVSPGISGLKEVVTGIEQQNEIEILEGLHENDLVHWEILE